MYHNWSILPGLTLPVLLFSNYKTLISWKTVLFHTIKSWCLSYFSIAANRHHDQGNLQKKKNVWCSQFQRVSPWPSWWEAWQQAARHAGLGGITPCRQVWGQFSHTRALGLGSWTPPAPVPAPLCCLSRVRGGDMGFKNLKTYAMTYLLLQSHTS